MYSFNSPARACLTLLLLLGVSLGVAAQAPLGFNFQAVARGTSDNILSDQTIAVRVSLLRGSDSGPADYSERHEVRTSNHGVFDLAVGTGETVSGSFAGVDWESASYYLKIDLDPNGGSNYVNMGATQLLSVPYALYANTAGNGGQDQGDGVGTTEDPTDELQALIYDPVTNTLTLTDGNSVVLKTGTDEQTLSLSGTTLEISNGNTVDLQPLLSTTGGEDADADPTNELQDISLTGRELTITGGSTVTLPSEAPQQISLSGNTLSLSGNGGSVELPQANGSGVVQQLTFDPATRALSISEGNNVFIPVGSDGDGDSENEIQQIKLTGNKLELSHGGGTVTLPSGEGSVVNTDNQELDFDAVSRELSIAGGNTVYIPAGKDDDADPSNELQKIRIEGTTLILSGDGGSVELPGGVDTDDQTLSFDPVTRNLSISEGNEVNIPVGTDGDGDSENEIQVLRLSGNKLELSNGGGSVTLPSSEGSVSNTDNQELSFDALSRELSIDGGNTIYIPAGEDADADPTNELQDISFDIATNKLSITGGSTIVLPTGGSDADPDPTNEIQVLKINGNKLELTNGGGSVTLPSSGSVENTDNQELSFDPMNRQLSIEGGNTVYIPGEEDPDTDPTNELQEIYLDGNKIVLTNGGGSITLPSGSGGTDGDGDPTNELQQFTFENGILKMSQDGGEFDVEGFIRPYITLMEEQMALVKGLTETAATYESIINDQIERADMLEATIQTLTQQAMDFQNLIDEQTTKAADMQTALETLAEQNAALEVRVMALENE
ncbi:hypothetical protein CLV84_3759 [Neolewinella xylanilytica]|uniref:Uncharacterized protein n=1 Tax=Neolewinella xylanilytica TaxID=1514080 RepID=A0A2S6I0U6_9BACT|nr:hypothetical protein [Neolewinella xylanilytica]PPK84597.1 hypothetical protein CLV84_3759 [Neolewinella xylanilytica]